MNQNNPRLGIALMISATAILSLQDGISRHLADSYNIWMVVMIRYWFFAAFVIALARRQGGIKLVAATQQLGLQVFRGVLLALEICVTVLAFLSLGLIETHAVFASYPLMVAALSGPILGENVGWRRWGAIAVGAVGILIILQPGVSVFAPAALIPLLGALMFALYGLLTRFAARRDTSATSFFWTGVAGAVTMTAPGLWFWQNMALADWGWMALLSLTGLFAHWLLIRCYEVAEASTVQPFAYFQLVFISALGVIVFAETLRTGVVLGTAVIVAAGLFTLLRTLRSAGS
jgi:drug/metabolite transporter (DMT)-like permease